MASATEEDGKMDDVKFGTAQQCPKCGDWNVAGLKLPEECRMTCLKTNKAPVADVLCNCNVGLKGRLITAAASLSLHKLSEFDDDYPGKFPKWVLRDIEKHNDHLGDIARELMSIKDAL
jgi:hypothetical protein